MVLRYLQTGAVEWSGKLRRFHHIQAVVLNYLSLGRLHDAIRLYSTGGTDTPEHYRAHGPQAACSVGTGTAGCWSGDWHVTRNASACSKLRQVWLVDHAQGVCCAGLHGSAKQFATHQTLTKELCRWQEWRAGLESLKGAVSGVVREGSSGDNSNHLHLDLLQPVEQVC
jgi:hypothetical protein